MPPETILILGGTLEAANLAARLVREKPAARIITSLAGRTREPAPVDGEVRTGGFGGADGLARYLVTEGITALIDATHPFALRISANAEGAAEAAGVPLTVLRRKPWERQPGDVWHEVASLEEARHAIPGNARVLLALGSQHIALFAERADVHFTVRMVDPPPAEAPLPFAKSTLILGKPGTVENESALLKDHAITHIVCRNSGGTGAYAKIEAARLIGLPVIIVQPRVG